MKVRRIINVLSCFMLVTLLMACVGGKKNVEESTVPEYVVVNNPQIDLADFEVDADGFISIFNGKDFTGWRGYGKEHVPTKWTIEDGAIKFNGSGGGEAQDGDGGDIIFTHKFKNFELQFEWKVDKGSNSGVFILVQEVEGQPSYISAPEYQVLDNVNHPDAKLGKDGDRQSASLYDMIPAHNSKQRFLSCLLLHAVADHKDAVDWAQQYTHPSFLAVAIPNTDWP